MWFKKKIGYFALALILVAVLQPNGLVAANRNQDPSSLYELLDPSSPNFDAQVYAIEENVTLEEGIHRLHLMDIAGPLHADLVTKEVESFGGGWIQHSPDFKFIVRFTNDPEERIKPYFLKYPELESSIEVRSADVSYKDLRDTQQQIVSDLSKAGIEAITGMDIRTARIEIYTVKPEKIDAAKQIGALSLPDNVDVIRVESLSGNESGHGRPRGTEATSKSLLDVVELIGGKYLWQYSGGSGGHATSGYSVYQTGTDPDESNNRGMSTAGHVAYDTQYYDIYYEGDYALSYVNYHTSVPYDIAIYAHDPAESLPTNRIQWWPDGSTRGISYVEAYSSMWVGEYVYKYGVETEYTVGQISDLNYGGNPGFIRVHNSNNYNLSDDGDSGAPWFRNNTAIGIHRTSAAENANDAVFSAAEYVSQISPGFSILTVP